MGAGRMLGVLLGVVTATLGLVTASTEHGDAQIYSPTDGGAGAMTTTQPRRPYTFGGDIALCLNRSGSVTIDRIE
jgi:hypothetical protein